MSDSFSSGERFPRELEILRQLADNVPQLVWVARPDGSHEYYNRRWFDYSGLTLAESTQAGGTISFIPTIASGRMKRGPKRCAPARPTTSSFA
jgi:PAS domain-containing protein